MNWEVLAQQLWTGLVNGAIYVMFASGINLVFGVMRVINMAHGELAMLGAMLAFTLASHLEWPFPLALVAAICLTAGFGAILNRIAIQPVLRGSRLMVLLSTLAMSFILVHGGVAIWNSDPKLIDTGFTTILSVGGLRVPTEQVLIALVGAGAISSVHVLIAKSRLGKMMRATAQNVVGAQLVGVNTTRVYDYTLMLAAGLAALAGVLMAPLVSAQPSMGQPLLVMGFAVVVVAGMGNLTGVAIVGLGFGVIEALFGQYVSTYYRQPFIYAIMVAALLVRPDGVFGHK
jgi:branched-chain amino acid transport system permease protein